MKGHNTPRLAALLSLLLVVGALWMGWPRSRAALYSFQRERGKEQALAGLAGYAEKESSHFVLWYAPADEAVADLVLETAEWIYEPVTARLGTAPAEQVPLVLYADRTTLQRAFGWSTGESAVGIYWRGTIRLLSPTAWIHADSAEQLRASYRRLNPIAHELTHYLLDYMTDGNYPHWFSEGLAQWIEYQVTGYLWIEPQSSLNQDLYSYTDLQRRFDQLTNQPLAYRQAHLLVVYLVHRFGSESLDGLVGRLDQGESFSAALQRETGLLPPAFFAHWLEWVQANLENIEAAS